LVSLDSFLNLIFGNKTKQMKKLTILIAATLLAVAKFAQKAEVKKDEILS